jgi:hypothetical protein
MAEQNFRNHSRFVPLFHFVVGPILLVNFFWACYRLFRGLPYQPVFDRLLDMLVALALVGVFFYARIFALTVQDRVIRLEERLRLASLLPDDLRARIPELTRGQLIALRFASDEELPALTRQVLDQRMRNPKEIKQQIRSWRADHLRV